MFRRPIQGPQITIEGAGFVALVQCGECGKDVSDKAQSCPNCGNPIVAAQTLVVVEGYGKSWIGFSHVDVYWNGEQVGQVAKGEVKPFTFAQGGTIEVRTLIAGVTGKKEYSKSWVIGDGDAWYLAMSVEKGFKKFDPRLLTEPPSGPTVFMGVSFPLP